MSRRMRWMLAVAILIVAVAGPLAYSSFYSTHFRNFRVVQDGTLYRSGQLTEYGLDSMVKEKGIRTVVSLRAARDSSKPHPDQFEEDYCKANGIQFVRLIPKVWSVHDGKVPADENVAKFLAILDNKANHPVLVHCFAGIHRTGTFCTIYRMEYNGWSNADALSELRSLGYENVDDHEDVLAYLKNYKPRAKRE